MNIYIHLLLCKSATFNIRILPPPSQFLFHFSLSLFQNHYWKKQYSAKYDSKSLRHQFGVGSSQVQVSLGNERYPSHDTETVRKAAKCEESYWTHEPEWYQTWNIIAELLVYKWTKKINAQTSIFCTRRRKLRTGWTSTDFNSHTGGVKCLYSWFDPESRRQILEQFTIFPPGCLPFWQLPL